MSRLGNLIKTTFLLGGMVVVFIIFGYLLGGADGMLVALVVSAVSAFMAYWQSGSAAVRAAQAQPLTEQQAPRLHRVIENLAARADIPKPEVYLAPTEMPNAFATGRNPGNAKVAVTQGIMDLLDDEELAGVLAHEISHVDNYDILTGSVAAVMAGALTFLARSAQYSAMTPTNDRRRRSNLAGIGILLAVLAPIAATIIQMAITRTREFAADEEGARLLGDPMPLANALAKMEQYSAHKPGPSHHAHPAYAHLYIIAPAVDLSSLSNLFSTHPPTEERIRRLMNMRVEPVQ